MKNQGPLTKVEKFYIAGNIEKGDKQLAEDLNRSLQSVRHYIEDLQEVEVKEEKKNNKNIAPTKPQKPNQNKDGYGRRKGAVVSSEGASQKADDLQLAKKAKKKERDGIYKPYSE